MRDKTGTLEPEPAGRNEEDLPAETCLDTSREENVMMRIMRGMRCDAASRVEAGNVLVR